jgi:ABC-type lipoprotein release transport system permease subunit
MTIPLAYNWRNLRVRWTTTLLTAAGIALTVAVLLAVLALVDGLEHSFESSGHPLNLLVTRKGATAEITSILTPATYQRLRARPGIARTRRGEPMVSLELVTGLAQPAQGSGTLSITLRGLTQSGWDLRENARVIEGRMFTPGRREVVVGATIARRHPQLGVGKTVKFARGEWLVTGVVDVGEPAGNNEIFVDLNQAAAGYNRKESLSTILVRAADEVALSALGAELKQDPQLNVQAVTQREYYASQMISAAPVQAMGFFVAMLLSIGSSFAAMNTMYTAVARRAAEIGTLRVLGFSRPAVLLSFLFESVLLSLLGGVLGCLLVLPLNGYGSSIGSLVSFSEVAFEFQVSAGRITLGLCFAMFMGGLGGFMPAWSAARKHVLTALRA